MEKKVILLFLALFIIPVKVFAAGSFSVSTSNVSINPGESKVVAITSSNAVGRLNISSSNGGIASTSTGSVFIQTPGGSESITITGNSIGTAVITVIATDNFATFDDETPLTGLSRTITVNVVATPAPTPAPNPTPSNNNNNNNNNNNSRSGGNLINPITDGSGKSSNCNIKELKIDGYDLIKVDNNNYTLSVFKYVDSVNIVAKSEDSKASVTGGGKHDLVIGDNNIAIIVTAEDGTQNIINVKIVRKEYYDLEDLEKLLKDDKINNPEIVIKEDTKITAKDLERIKSSKKIVTFNYNNNDKKLMYSFIIDGSKLKSTNDFLASISNNSENKKDILKLSNYADGLFRVLKETNNLPNGLKVKLFVGDKYDDNDLVNIYLYDKKMKRLELVSDKLKVEKGYIEFEVGSLNDYFITMSNISDLDNVVVSKSNSISLIVIILVTIMVLISVGIFTYLFLVLIKNKENNSHVSNLQSDSAS